jgi:transposase
MTETTRSPECSALPLYLAFELGSTKWTLAFTTSAAQRPRIRSIVAGDLTELQREIDRARDRCGVPRSAPVRSCYEAGRDGFWLHRWLVAHGVANVVVDSSSIEVKRRARWAKTDRLDVGKLLSLLLRWTAGEPKVWSVVQVPTPEAEAARQVTREIETVRRDRMRLRSRLQGLLATQGIRCALTRGFEARLEQLSTGDGRPLPPRWRARLAREWAHLQVIETRLRTLRTERTAAVRQADPRAATVARQIATLRGFAETGATICSTELFGTRTFRNRKQVGALLGLVPVPHRSDQMVRDLGISKAASAEMRRLSIQLAWCWVRWQPDSALTQWFHRRFGSTGRSRRVGIVPVARKLMIAVWRFVAFGVLPEGARLKVA